MEHENINMTVKDLKCILQDLPDDMAIVIPVISEDDCNQIFGFRHVRTAGVLFCEFETNYPRVLALNGAAGPTSIEEQVKDRDVVCEKILF